MGGTRARSVANLIRDFSHARLKDAHRHTHVQEVPVHVVGVGTVLNAQMDFILRTLLVLDRHDVIVDCFLLAIILI